MGSYRLWPEPDYPDAVSYYNCSSQEDVRELVSRFASLYKQATQYILPTLDALSEFAGSPELQNKTVLSVIVVSSAFFLRLNKDN